MDVVTGAVIVPLLAMAMAAYWLFSVSESESSGVKRPTDVPPRNDPQLRIERILRRATDLAAITLAGQSELDFHMAAD